jgi:hypothetical protein
MAHTRHKPGAFALVLTIFLGLFTTVHAHSCVERLMRIAYNNGSMVGTPGFPRGYIDRNAPNVGDFDNQTIFRINMPIESYQLAHPSQRTFNYSQQFPPLTAAPGDLVALQYQDNGHVTFSNGPPDALTRPENRGTVYIYGTANPISSDAKLLDIHYHWNVEGTGGDGKGKLLATRNYDDGQCYQVSDYKISKERQAKFSKTVEPPGMGDLWCQSDFSLPDDLEVGKPYTLIWVWDWPQMSQNGVAISPVSPPGEGSKVFPFAVGNNGAMINHPELYTTVMDINIVDPCDEKLGTVKGPSCKTSKKIAYNPLETDLNKASVANQCTNNFLVDISGLQFNGSSPSPSAPGSGSAPGPAPSKSASSSASPSDSASAPGPASSKSANPSASPSDSASAPAHHSGNGRTKTVIETVPYTTVTVTVQPTEDATTSSDASATSATSTSSDTSTAVTSSQSAQTTGSKAYGAEAPAVTPVTSITGFMTSSQVGAKKIRREAGAWTFGHG